MAQHVGTAFLPDHATIQRYDGEPSGFQAITRETQQQIHRVLTPQQRAHLRTLQQERTRLMNQGEIRPPQQMRQMQTREEILRQLGDERMRGRQPARQRAAPPKAVVPDTGVKRRR